MTAMTAMTPTAGMKIITKPILFLHGVGGHANEYDDIIAFVQHKYGNDHAAPPMHSLDICEGACSLVTAMPQQRDDMMQYLQDHAEELNITDGFHWVAHSQGSVLARAVIQALPSSNNNLHVHTFVSMAGPQMGQWGECSMNRSQNIPDSIAKKMSRPYGWIAFYNALAQHELSIANYWHDPKHYEAMLREARLLPALNGYDTTTVNMTAAKDNFLRLQKAVFVGSEDDDCINPPLSSVFQFVDEDGRVLRLEDSMEYRNDTFGLQTMKKDGRLFLQSYPGIRHLDWRLPSVFEQYVLPHLLEEVISSNSTTSYS